MSLVPDYEDTTDDSDRSDEEEDDRPAGPPSPPRPPTPPACKLPKPGFLNADKNGKDPSTTSVFTNPFIEAEIAKKAILEKHVKMVSTKDNAATINGKKVCWNYRKGRCRFGHNCKYAHDSDLQKTKEQLDLQNQVEQTVICQSREPPQPTVHELTQIKEDSLTIRQKRKRPGLTQGLVPGKKVMKNYRNQHKAQ